MVDSSRVDPFVGRNAEYYAERWRTMADGTSSRVRWNWAAAILGAFWLLYRKLYAPFAIVMFIVVVDSLGGIALEEAGILPSAVVATWDRLSVWVYSAVIGCWGNYWYYKKFSRTLESATEQFVDPAEQELHLAQSGGTD